MKNHPHSTRSKNESPLSSQAPREDTDILVRSSGCSPTSFDGLGGLPILNVRMSCEEWAFSKVVDGESGFGVRFAAFTARLRCHGVLLTARPIRKTGLNGDV